MATIQEKTNAIQSLSPTLAFHVHGDGTVELAKMDGQTNDGVIPSEADIQTEITRIQDFQPTQDWMDLMAVNDFEMSRVIEDILDGMADKSGVNQITLARLQSKKDLRATKP